MTPIIKPPSVSAGDYVLVRRPQLNGAETEEPAIVRAVRPDCQPPIVDLEFEDGHTLGVGPHRILDFLPAPPRNSRIFDRWILAAIHAVGAGTAARIAGILIALIRRSARLDASKEGRP